MGRFNFSKISKSIFEFYFLRFCHQYDWNLWGRSVSNKYFSRNEIKGLISNTSYMGCLDHKLHRRSSKLSQFLSLSQTGPEKNINHNSRRARDQPFRSSFIYTNKSKHSSNHRFSSFLYFLLVWYWTNILDSYF